MVKWTPEYSVHVKEIDEQHNVIVAVTNELSELVKKGSPRSLVGTVIRKLLSFAQYHFATEEKYFALFEYEFTREHVDEHNTMLNRLDQFEREHFEMGKDVTADLVNFTMLWLTDHILRHDKKYVDCFQKHGLR